MAPLNACLERTYIARGERTGAQGKRGYPLEKLNAVV